MRHIPVLLAEVIESLQLKPGKTVIDCTLGDAGHSEAILKATAPNGKLVGIDADPESLLRAKQYLYGFGERAVFARDNFAQIKKIAAENNCLQVDGILMDLGWSSPQFAERGRGFSFEKDEPLDMRYAGQSENALVKNGARPLTAADVVNTYDWDELYRIFRMYGEEDLAKEIAEAVVTARKKSPLNTTKQLVDIVLDVYRKKLKTDKPVPWIGGLHPATKVFQALRIEVNHELEVLREALPQAVDLLATGGRLAVITFHSLEDRIVKHYFSSIDKKSVKLVNKKPITATEKELDENTRSRSAKLRVVEKI